MTDYITLMGAEAVQSAGYAMKGAAEQMSRAASNIDQSLIMHQRFMDDWLRRLEAAISQPNALR